MTQIKNLMILLTVLTFSAPAMADVEMTETEFLLMEAMMQSNADYNKHKKDLNHEEDDRADAWSNRGSQAIAINQKELSTSDNKNFRELRNELGAGDREVSSNDKQKKDLLKD